MKDYEAEDRDLHFVADELKGILPAGAIENFRSLIENSEVGIGLEMLLDDIYEYDIVLPKNIYDILEKYGKGDINDSYFEGIRYKEK